MRPLVVVEGATPVEVGRLTEEIRRAGWTVTSGFAPGAGEDEERAVRVGWVETEGDMSAAVMAAVRGTGLVVAANGGNEELVEDLCDDLRRLGPVEHRVVDASGALTMETEERLILEALTAGKSVRDAAAAVHVSVRTAFRRIESLRVRLGVANRAELLVVVGRAGALGPTQVEEPAQGLNGPRNPPAPWGPPGVHRGR